MFVVIEGLPRTGKTTVARELAHRLQWRHDEYRPPPDIDPDAYVLGRAHSLYHIDWEVYDLIMDRQLPSSYVFAKYRSDDEMCERYMKMDSITNCIYIRFVTHEHDVERISKETEKGSRPFYTPLQLREMDGSLNFFMQGSHNKTFFVETHETRAGFAPLAGIRRKTVGEMVEECMYIINSNRPSWDRYFMTIAKKARARSTCLSRHVGAVVTVNNRIAGVGYSGQPSGVPSCQTCRRKDARTGELLSESRAVHAEINAIINSHIDLTGGTLYSTTEPCAECTKAIINSGIKSVKFMTDYPSELRDDLLMMVDIDWELIG